jgi:putative ABC transport system substrate-binding protein
MKRREFVTLLGAAAVACPLVVRAQEQRRIGVMTSFAPDNPLIQHWLKEVSQQLESRGWKEGANLRIDYYGGHRDDVDEARVFAKVLVSVAPDVILVRGSTTLSGVRQETQTIPIVFVGGSDPVGKNAWGLCGQLYLWELPDAYSSPRSAALCHFQTHAPQQK